MREESRRARPGVNVSDYQLPLLLVPVIPPPARSVRASNGDEPLTQRRTRRTRAQMQADYDQMTPAEKAVRDRVTTRNSERAVARAATRNTARQTEI